MWVEVRIITKRMVWCRMTSWWKNWGSMMAEQLGMCLGLWNMCVLLRNIVFGCCPWSIRFLANSFTPFLFKYFLSYRIALDWNKFWCSINCSLVKSKQFCLRSLFTSSTAVIKLSSLGRRDEIKIRLSGNFSVATLITSDVWETSVGTRTFSQSFVPVWIMNVLGWLNG